MNRTDDDLTRTILELIEAVNALPKTGTGFAADPETIRTGLELSSR